MYHESCSGARNGCVIGDDWWWLITDDWWWLMIDDLDDLDDDDDLDVFG